jgi:hypothetical protein
MIALYKTKCTGPYHKKNGIPCQDSYAYEVLDNGYIVAAVADGLGSCKRSDVGSKVAADSAVAVCSGKLGNDMSDEEIIEIMKLAYMVADVNVSTIAEKAGDMSDEYDTTLCLAIYDGRNLYYGQAGDSGLIALTNTGEYIPVTSQQRDEDGAVFPLCFGLSYWEFGKVERDVSGYALMTDGIWEQLFPPLLKDEEIRINVPLAEKMINYFEIEEGEIIDLEKMMSEYWEKCPEKFIDDDKTSVCVINTGFVPTRKSVDYYNEPDWASLREKARKEREKKIQHSFEAKDISAVDTQETNDFIDERIDSLSDDNAVENVLEFVQIAKDSITKGVERVKGTFKEEKLEIPFERKSMEDAVEQLKQRKDKQKAESNDDEADRKTNVSKKSTALPIHIDIRM